MDEHYYPTLFAMHDRQEETDCKGVLTVAEFRWAGRCLPAGWRACGPQSWDMRANHACAGRVAMATR